MMIETSRPGIRRAPFPFALLVVLLAALLCGVACRRTPEPLPVAPPEAPTLAAEGEMIRYVLRFPEPQTHLVEIEAVFPSAGREALELRMATWTPGSYLIREFARHVEGLVAVTPDGEPLEVRKTTKNRWLVETGGAAWVSVRYRLYCREASVRTNFVDADMAVLNGAATFFTTEEGAARPHEVRLELPGDWQGSATALEPHPSGEASHYLAQDFDTLVDSPIVAGRELARREFQIENVPHSLVTVGDASLWDLDKAAADIETITRAQVEFWGTIPYPRYLYLNVLSESGGGLEHQNSTLMMTGRFAFRDKDWYSGWLQLAAHEFFHTWNVKRLRPRALGPFDYESEVYTRSLWIAEGVTSYYGPLLLRRAGLIDRKEFLEELSETIDGIQARPGRLVQPLALSSFDAWIKHYRPDENSGNTSINYYSKGQVVAFLLDAEIRRRTRGRHSLDGVMRRAAELYSGETGYTPEEFRAVVAEVAGESFDAFFASHVDRADELDYGAALEYFGLRFAPSGEKDDAEAVLGLQLEERAGRLHVRRVERGTAAYAAGFNVDDELLAINGYRILPGRWDDHRGLYEPGDEVVLTVSRRGALREITARFEASSSESWKLEVDPRAGRSERKRLEAWLGE